MKKIISMIIVLSMLLSLALPAFAAEKASGKMPMVLAELSDMNTVSKAGLKTSTEFAKKGFSAVLEGNALKKSTTIAVKSTDISAGEYLEFYMYSPVATATAFALA